MLNLKVEVKGIHSDIYDKVEMCKRLHWTALGKSMQRWGTLDQFNIEIQLKEEDEVLEKLREVITDGMDGVRHVLVFT